MQRYSSFFFCLIFYCIILVCCVCLLVFTFFIVIFQLKFSKDPLEEIILLFVEKNVFLISLYIYKGSKLTKFDTSEDSCV